MRDFSEFEPVVIEETEHYVKVEDPSVAFAEFAAFGERMFSLGLRVLSGNGRAIWCEKLKVAG